MFNKESMTQKSGDNSSNYQAETINIKQGVDCKEVIAIFDSLMPRHLEKFTGIALEEARHLFEQFKTELLEKLDQRYFPKFQLPAVQFSLFEAQREYAKCSDPETQAQILSSFIERVKSGERSLKQIVFDQAILTIPKLPKDYIDMLSLFVMFSLDKPVRFNSSDNFFDELAKGLTAFHLPQTSLKMMQYHLVSCGCTVGLQNVFIQKDYMLGDWLMNTCRGLFSTGFSDTDLTALLGDDTQLKNRLICQCLHDPSKIQFRFVNEKDLNNFLKERRLSFLSPKLCPLFQRTTMTPEEIEQYMAKRKPELLPLINTFKDIELQNVQLTLVGDVIGAQNFSKKTSTLVVLDALFQ